MTQQDTQATEAYFRSMNDMVRSEGWDNLMKELHATANQVNSVELTKDAEDLAFRKGQLVILANLLNLETQIANAQQEFEASPDESIE